MVNISQESAKYILESICDAITLLDNVHCYETEEFEELKEARDKLYAAILESEV